jgi:patatin-like phospholipase/acyl hydrolase
MVIDKLLGNLKAQDVFHIITGTSTGGIIACGLAKPNPMSPQAIIDLYVEKGGSIFTPVSLGLMAAKYNPNILLGYLGEEFEKTHLSDINKTGGKAELLVPSYAIGLPKENPPGNTCSPMFFRSWQARGLLLEDNAKDGEYDFRLSGIARATSAAPTYFPPQQIQNKLGEWFTMIDGGVFANNPTMAAIVEAHKLYDAEKFLVVSIGTGSQPTKVNASAAERWGDAQWLMPLLTILMEGSAETTDTEVQELLAKDYWRFDVSLSSPTPQGESVDPAMDNASEANVKALQGKANQLIAENSQRLEDLAKLLAAPISPLRSNTVRPSGGLLSSQTSTPGASV